MMHLSVILQLTRLEKILKQRFPKPHHRPVMNEALLMTW